MSDRAVLFIDGNNWYHSLKDVGVPDLGRLDYARISKKLVGPRDWIATRYYIGRVPQVGNPALYADQRRFLAQLEATDSRISTHLGRLESHVEQNDAATELRSYLGALRTRIDAGVFHQLMEIAKKYEHATVMVEKAVDVMLAGDMVTMATQDRYDAAYLLSADGDYTPAVDAVREVGRRIYAVSPLPGAQLARAVNSFIRIPRDWFTDCYLP